jgi:hypothetical protein
MVMPGVRVNTAAGFVLQGHLHLVSASHGNHVTGKQLSIICDDDRKLVAIFHVHRKPIEVIAILLKDEVFRSFPSNRVDGQNDLIIPLLNRHAQLQPLPRSISPVDESDIVLRLIFVSQFVRQSNKELQCARRPINLGVEKAKGTGNV